MERWCFLCLFLILSACNSGDSEQPAETKSCQNESIRLPIAGQPNTDWFVSNYVDVNHVVGEYLDYSGGYFSYDEHLGVDFALADFDQMDSGVTVYAAKCGVVTNLHDGEFDRQTSANQSAWNYIEITHDDGSRTLYGHLQRGSLAVQVGQQVSAGQTIANVGSSGNSSGAHLHFELIDALGNHQDPFGTGLFDSVYVHSAYLFDAGITSSSDPTLLDDFYIHTPSKMNNLMSYEDVSVWIKVVGLRQNDMIQIQPIQSPGKSLGSFESDKNYKAGYWFWNLGTLPTGEHEFAILVNGEPQQTVSVSIQ